MAEITDEQIRALLARSRNAQVKAWCEIALADPRQSYARIYLADVLAREGK